MANSDNTTSKRTERLAGRRRLLSGASKAILITIAALLLVLAGAVAIVLIDANFLRTPIARYLSDKLERSVAIDGDLRIRLFRDPRVEINQFTLANSDWGSRPEMVAVERAVIRFRVLPLFRKRVVLPGVELTKPDVLLETNADGDANWRFGKQRQQTTTGTEGAPEIHALWIRDGRVQFRDPSSKSDLVVEIDSDRAADSGESGIKVAGKGRVRNEQFALEGRADSLLELNQRGKPYRIALKVRAGATTAKFDGAIVPLKLETIDGRMELSGRDLSELYPLVPVPLPWTSTYRIAGHLVRDGKKYSLREMSGKVGGSDIQGAVSIDLAPKRPLVTADLTSRRLDQGDLAGFLGAPPPEKGKQRPPEQQRKIAEQQATGKALPTKPYNLKALRSVDARVKLKAMSIIPGKVPLDNMVADLTLDDGVLRLEPLVFGVASGRVTSHITLDAQEDVMQTKLQATVENLEAKELLPELKRSPGSAGKIGGRANLSTRGNSVSDMAATATGELALIMSQGRASTLTLVLTNLDLANAVKYVVFGDPNALVHCGVLDARLENGRATPQLFVVDSSEERINGEGNVDFKTEQYDLRLVADSKRASLVALRGPIRIGGTFKDPKVMPEVGPIAARVGAAVALGVLATPLAALIALVDPGNAKSANCAALVEQTKQSVRSSPVAPDSTASGQPAAAQSPSKERGTDVRPNANETKPSRL